MNVDVDPANAFHQFVPGDVTINPGDTVVWTWRGNFHSVTSGDPGTGVQSGLFNTNVHNSGFTFSFTFPDPGTFSYFCIPHREMGMSGNVIVNGASTQLANISTRLAVQTGDNALIGGFIVDRPGPEKSDRPRDRTIAHCSRKTCRYHAGTLRPERPPDVE